VSDHPHRKFESDAWAWTVICLIFGGVNLALWAPFLWDSLHG
jgi:hypothetical protein